MELSRIQEVVAGISTSLEPYEIGGWDRAVNRESYLTNGPV